MRNHIAAAALAAGTALLATACGSSSPSAAPAARAKSAHHAKTTAKTKSRKKAKPHASPSCTRTVTFDYIERTVWPPLAPSADEIGNTDYGTCTSSLADFGATAGQAPGECTTIALASSNPGYDASATPAAPLKDVIESAGPGC